MERLQIPLQTISPTQMLSPTVRIQMPLHRPLLTLLRSLLFDLLELILLQLMRTARLSQTQAALLVCHPRRQLVRHTHRSVAMPENLRLLEIDLPGLSLQQTICIL